MLKPDWDKMLAFGQPLGAIMQEAYIVPDIAEAIKHFSSTLGAGPFFTAESFPLIDATYRGQPCNAAVALAIGFSGNFCYELIQLKDQEPSPWKEGLDKKGYGYHHRAITTGDFDGAMDYYRNAGYEIALHTKVVFGTRAAYIDTGAVNYGMIELIEMNDAVEAFFGSMKKAAEEWDGKDPVRSIG